MLKIIDPNILPKHFDSGESESKWSKFWEAQGTFRYDDKRPREETFVVDTPPPTVSGSLHVGHVFSYTQTDILVRQQRMLGKNIFYPMGWDDNGLPTERRVQNYFHVRCDLQTPYDANLKIDVLSDKEQKETPPRLVSRQNFIELCERLTKEDEKAFKDLWTRIGLSVDWQQEYATIDQHSRRLAQLSFLDLLKKDQVFSLETPTMWDIDFQTAVAQAEVEDRTVPSAFHQIEFGIENAPRDQNGQVRSIVIATTRPELLPACVGIAAHPEDERYKDLFGKKAISPIFKVPVPIFPTELADPEKGTGILMVCTFGDANDVVWWREEKLPLRQIIGKNGRFLPVTFQPNESSHESKSGEANNWISLDPGHANKIYFDLVGKTVHTARKLIVELLRDPQQSSVVDTNRPPLQGEPAPLQHAVKFFEKGDRPLEFVSTRQWFVRLLDKKEQLLKKGEQVQWHPEFMHNRFADWTKNLQLDWCISRQRYFGVPFPIWYALDLNGQPQYERPLVPADNQQLPLDPMNTCPPGYTENQRNQPGGFSAETDVFDTWFTSSLTPQIGSHWLLDPKRHQNLFPADVRPQSHEIIRTWAFYTIAKALLHEDQIPWKHVAVSGWILDPDRKKMSKSKGNVITPMNLLDQYTADGVRYWAASARLGVDTAFDQEVFKVGKRLVTKIYNASKFVLSQSASADGPICEELDLAFINRLNELVVNVTNAFTRFEYAQALAETERFFWTHFTDTYIELVKVRAKGESPSGAVGQASAVATLRLGLNTLLRLFAPFLPFITEEVWSWIFAEEMNCASIHQAPWPKIEELNKAAVSLSSSLKNPANFEVAVNFLAAINKHKASLGVSLARGISSLEVIVHPQVAAHLPLVSQDVKEAAKVQKFTLRENAALEEPLHIEVSNVELAAD